MFTMSFNLETMILGRFEKKNGRTRSINIILDIRIHWNLGVHMPRSYFKFLIKVLLICCFIGKIYMCTFYAFVVKSTNFQLILPCLWTNSPQDPIAVVKNEREKQNNDDDRRVVLVLFFLFLFFFASFFFFFISCYNFFNYHNLVGPAWWR